MRKYLSTLLCVIGCSAFAQPIINPTPYSLSVISTSYTAAEFRDALQITGVVATATNAIGNLDGFGTNTTIIAPLGVNTNNPPGAFYVYNGISTFEQTNPHSTLIQFVWEKLGTVWNGLKFRRDDTNSVMVFESNSGMTNGYDPIAIMVGNITNAIFATNGTVWFPIGLPQYQKASHLLTNATVDFKPLILVFEGDSLTAGHGLTNAGYGSFDYFLTNEFWTNWNIARATNIATPSEGIASILGKYGDAGRVYENRPNVNTNGIVFIWAGINDLGLTGTNALTVYNNLTNFWLRARGDGFKVAAFTVTSATNYDQYYGFTSNRIVLNEMIRRNSSLYDYLIDVDKLLPDQWNSTWMQDNVHFNTNGQRLIASEVDRVIRLGQRAAPNTRGSQDLFSQVVMYDRTNYAYPNSKVLTAGTNMVVYTNGLQLIVASTTRPQSTNGFTDASVTNGLASITYAQGLTNGFTDASVTNGLASQTYAQGLTNGFTDKSVTNTLLGASFTNFLASTNQLIVTSNGLQNQISAISVQPLITNSIWVPAGAMAPGGGTTNLGGRLGATAAIWTNASTVNDIYRFTSGTNACVTFSWAPGPAFAGVIRPVIHWATTNVNAGDTNLVWEFACEPLTSNSISGAFTYLTNSTFRSWSSNSLQVAHLPQITITNLSHNIELECRISRLGTNASDLLLGEALLRGVRIGYNATNGNSTL